MGLEHVKDNAFDMNHGARHSWIGASKKAVMIPHLRGNVTAVFS